MTEVKTNSKAAIDNGNAAVNKTVSDSKAESTVVEQKPEVKQEPKQVQSTSPTANLKPAVNKRKFEIKVYEADDEASDMNGNPVRRWKPVNYKKPVIIEAGCAKDLEDLKKQYAMCDQTFKIIREIDAKPVQEINPSFDNTPTIAQVQQVQTQPTPVKKSKPKIISIPSADGDIQIKYDGDKVYRKQWIKLSQKEAANVRVVQNSSNKIVSMSGKHIEVKKWVMVEESEEDDVI